MKRRPAPGYMSPHQIVNLVGNFGEVIVLRHGVAYLIDRMVEDPQGVWSVHMTNRHGRQTIDRMLIGDMWYVTRKDLVGWDVPPRQTPFQDL